MLSRGASRICTKCDAGAVRLPVLPVRRGRMKQAAGVCWVHGRAAASSCWPCGFLQSFVLPRSQPVYRAAAHTRPGPGLRLAHVWRACPTNKVSLGSDRSRTLAKRLGNWPRRCNSPVFVNGMRSVGSLGFWLAFLQGHSKPASLKTGDIVTYPALGRQDEAALRGSARRRRRASLRGNTTDADTKPGRTFLEAACSRVGTPTLDSLVMRR